MAKVNLSKMSREDLLKLKGEIDAQLKANEKNARKNALDAVKKAAAAHGFSLDEIISEAPKKRGPKPGKPKAKVPAKYANPADKSQTWTGRGRQPNWIKDALANGKTLESMAI